MGEGGGGFHISEKENQVCCHHYVDGQTEAGSLSKLLTQECGINPKGLCFWEKGVATEFSLIRIFILL